MIHLFLICVRQFSWFFSFPLLFLRVILGVIYPYSSLNLASFLYYIISEKIS